MARTTTTQNRRLSRRTFLAASGVGGTALAAGGAFALTGHGLDAQGENPSATIAHAAAAHPLTKGTGVLVLVTCYGGNDGLNTVIPAADPVYAKARPTLSYAAADVLPLADGVGLNPAMKRMKSMYDGGRLAVIRGVGYPQPDHSHFRSMAIWQTASPSEPTTTGWLGRWLDTQPGDPLRAIAIGPTVPPLLVGARSVAAAIGVGTLALPAALASGFTGLAAAESGGFPLAANAAQADEDLLTVVARLGPVLSQTTGSGPADSPAAGGDATGAPASAAGKSQLAAELDVVARCIAAGSPTRVYSVSAGGFDTHVGEKTTHERLLGDLDASLGSFMDTIGKTANGADVVVAVYSEFGRRLAENDGDGTDHGEAAPMFVLGAPVAGGLYGEEPSLTKLDAGDLVQTTDFRDVYTELLTGVLDGDPGSVLPGAPGKKVGFLT